MTERVKSRGQMKVGNKRSFVCWPRSQETLPETGVVQKTMKIVFHDGKNGVRKFSLSSLLRLKTSNECSVALFEMLVFFIDH